MIIIITSDFAPFGWKFVLGVRVGKLVLDQEFVAASSESATVRLLAFG